MRARNTPPWWADRPMASLVKRIAQAQQPRGTVNGIRFGVAVAGFFFHFHKPLIRHG